MPKKSSISNFLKIIDDHIDQIFYMIIDYINADIKLDLENFFCDDTPAQRVMMQCGNYLDGKGNCNVKALYQEILESSTLQLINELFIKNMDVI